MVTRTTALIAAGAALAGAAVIGIPTLVVAAVNDDDRPGWGRDDDWDGPGMMDGPRGEMRGGFGDRFDHGPGMMGGGMMGGRGHLGGPFGWDDREPAGELSDTQADQLATMAEREKMARDLYTAFADETGDVRFERLAWAEGHHLQALQAMLDVYEVTDPTGDNGPGEFTDDEVAADYQARLEDGSGSDDAALAAARDLERSLADTLDDAADDVEDAAPDVSRVYEHLSLGSEHHLQLLES